MKTRTTMGVRAVAVLTLLATALALGIVTTADGRFDGRTLLAFIFIGVAGVIQMGGRR